MGVIFIFAPKGPRQNKDFWLEYTPMRPGRPTEPPGEPGGPEDQVCSDGEEEGDRQERQVCGAWSLSCQSCQSSAGEDEVWSDGEKGASQPAS